MGRKSWFDTESSETMFTEYLEKMESWQKPPFWSATKE